MQRGNLKINLTIDEENLNQINTRIKLISGVEIVKEKDQYIIPKELFVEKEVQDEVRYRIEIKKMRIDKIKFIGEKIGDIKFFEKRYSEFKKVVIILESPHKDEYTFDYKPIGVAQGKTGRELHNHLQEIIELFDMEDGKYIFIISNPVKFQASLGSFTNGKMVGTFRDNIWTALYKQGEYKQTLSKYSPKYILNATSSGRQIRIKKLLNEIKCRSENTNHPSNWDKEIKKL